VVGDTLGTGRLGRRGRVLLHLERTAHGAKHGSAAAVPRSRSRALASGPGLSWAYAATIVLGAVGGGFVSRVLSTSSLVYLGEISFAVYLVHTPVMSVVTEGTWSYAFFWHVPLLVGASTTLAAAAWLHALVEQPARQAILARSAGIGERLRVYASTASVAVRSRALVLLTGLSITAVLVAFAAVPTVEAGGVACGREQRGPAAWRALR
jgi:hypothetical protein